MAKFEVKVKIVTTEEAYYEVNAPDAETARTKYVADGELLWNSYKDITDFVVGVKEIKE